MDDRSAVIEIAGEKHELILTMKATKEIAKKYGGTNDLAEKLMKSENFESAIDEMIWLITLLANQAILRYNLKNSPTKPLLTEEELELFTSPADLGAYKDAILEAMYKGAKRNIESAEDDTSKNAIVG